LRRAVELDPGGGGHGFGLARVYVDPGGRDEARQEPREAITLPAIPPEDDMHRDLARRLLQEL
jgi:hypothetical protein